MCPLHKKDQMQLGSHIWCKQEFQNSVQRNRGTLHGSVAKFPRISLNFPRSPQIRHLKTCQWICETMHKHPCHRTRHSRICLPGNKEKQNIRNTSATCLPGCFPWCSVYVHHGSGFKCFYNCCAPVSKSMTDSAHYAAN